MSQIVSKYQTVTTNQRLDALYVIDSRIGDQDTLIAGLPEDAAWVVLDDDRDGLEQLRDLLAGYSGLSSLHLIGHGTPGSLLLGLGQINLATINQQSAVLAQIGQSLNANGDILLYGCNVGQGDTGQQLIEHLGRLTQADIAASTDQTGALGNWVLEAQSGSIEAATLNVPNFAETLGATLSISPLSTSNARPTLSGVVQLASGRTLEVDIAGKTYKVGDGKLNVSGSTWTLNLSADSSMSNLSVGAYDIKARVVDAAPAAAVPVTGSGTVTASSTNAVNLLSGSNSNDSLNGQTRADIAVFSGNRSNYTVSTNANGSVTVTDTRSSGGQGTDTLSNLNQLKFADGQEFVLAAAERVALTGSETGGIQVNASKLYNGTKLAETFVVSKNVSAMILAGAGDTVDLSGRISDYTYTPKGSQLQISDGTYTTTVNLGGAVTLRTASGSTTATLSFSSGQPVVKLGTVTVDGTAKDYSAAITPSSAVSSNAMVIESDAGVDELQITAVQTVLAAPTLTYAASLENSAYADVGSGLTLTFSTSVTHGTGNIYLYKQDGTLVETFAANNAQLNYASNGVTIRPTWDLEGSANYYVTMDAGAVAATAGNASSVAVSSATALAFHTGVETSVTAGAASLLDTFPGTSSESIGGHNVLFIRATYTDLVRAPVTDEDTAKYMAVLGDFWADNSMGRISVTPTFTPLITLPWTVSWEKSQSNFYAIQNSARSEALKLGYDPSQYDAVIVEIDDGLPGFSLGGGDSVWLGWIAFRVTVHEMAHALGMEHAGFLFADGHIEPYGNDYNIMGASYGQSAYYQSNDKLNVGWIPSTAYIENPDNGLQRIYAYDESYYVAGRQYGIHFDVGGHKFQLEYHPLPGGRVESSALLLRIEEVNDSSSQLIDTTPGSTVATGMTAQQVDAGIDVGRTYSIPDNNGSFTNLTVLSKGDGYLDINVQRGPFSSNVAPTASFTTTASNVKTADAITFNANAADANGDALAYYWQFSDGVVGSGASFTRNFMQSAATNVTATLTVSDMRGGSVQRTAIIHAGAATTDTPLTVTNADNVAPVLSSLYATATNVKATESVSFTATATDSNNDTLSYLWQFSDGVVGSGATYSRQFMQGSAEDVTAVLTVSDAHGGTAQLSTIIHAGAASTATPITVTPTAAGTTSALSPQVAVTASQPFGAEGGAAAEFTFTRVGGDLTQALVINLAYTGTATSGADFTALPASITIPANQASVTLSVNPLNDTAIENVETLTVTMSGVSNNAFAISTQNTSATIRITDNDTPFVSIQAIDDTASELGRDSGTFLITRTGSTDQALTVYYGVDGTAFLGTDYARLNGQVIIPAGASSVAVMIQPLDDNSAETTETVKLTLASFNDTYSVAADGYAATVNILDNPGDLAQVSVRTRTHGTEGGATSPEFVIRATGNAAGTVTVNYTVSGTATSGVDFTALSGSVTVSTDGIHDVSIPVALINDTLAESAESLVITLTPSSAYLLGDSSAEAFIFDNDSGANLVSVSTYLDQPAEVSTGTSTGLFYVYREGTVGAITVPYTLNGTATPGVDFSGIAQTGTVTIPDGQQGVVLTFNVLNDSVGEGSETLGITLGAGSGYSLSMNNSTSYWIADNDPTAITVGFKDTALTIAEAGDPTGNVRDIEVVLSGAASSPISVSFQAAGGSATGNNVDWTFLDPATNAVIDVGALTFAVGETSKFVRVRVNSDRVIEPAETGTLRLVNPVGASITTNRSDLALTIQDELQSGVPVDSANRYVRLLGTGNTVRENDGSDPLLLVTLDRPAGNTPITLQYTVSGTATSGSDYTLASTSLTFNPGELTKAIPLSLLTDGTGEAPENIRINLTSASGAILSGPANYELLLLDTAAPSLIEAHGFAASSLTSGALVTTVTATPAASHTVTQWEILAGNAIIAGSSDKAFAIDNQGRITIANPAALPMGSVEMKLTVQATDSTGAASDGVVAVIVNGVQGLLEQRWTGSDAYNTQSWSALADYTGYLTESAAARNVADNFSRRMTGLLKPTTSGAYTFWLTSDDNSRLYLGSDRGEDSKQLIATLGGAVGYQDWANGVRSVTINLVSGQSYWFEVQQLEGSGGDHASVAWEGPGISRQIIPASAFAGMAYDGTNSDPVLGVNYKSAVTTYTIDPVIGTNTGGTATIQAGGATRDQTMALTGQADAGSTVHIYDGTTYLGIATLTGTQWSFTTPALAEGAHALCAQITDAVGNVATTAAVAATVQSYMPLPAVFSLLSHDATVGGLNAANNVDSALVTATGIISDQLANASLVGTSGDGRYAIYGTNIATDFGFSDTRSGNGSPYSDLIVVDQTSNTKMLATHDSSATSTKGYQASYLGISVDSAYVLFTSPWAENYGTFSGNAGVMAYTISTGASRLLTHTSGSQTTGAAGVDTSSAKTSNDGQYLFYVASDATQFGQGTSSTAFTDSAPSSTDLFAVRLSDGAVSLLSHASSNLTASAGEAIAFAGQSADGKTAFFTAADASKFGFTDNDTAKADLIAVDVATGVYKLVSHTAAVDNTTAGASTSALIKSVGNYAYFTTTDSTVLGATGDGDTTRTDLWRYDLTSGATALISHGLGNTNAYVAMNGSYIANSLIVSDDQRYVAYTMNMPKGSHDGINVGVAGDLLFVTDLSAGTTSIVNHSNGNLTSVAWQTYYSYPRAKGWSADNSTLVFDTNSASDFGLTGTPGQNGWQDRLVLSYDMASGAFRLLSHTADASGKVQGASETYAGMSADGKWALFTANDATKFGNNGVAFTDSNATGADLFASNVQTGEIRLLSGTGGASTGGAASYVGLSADGNTAYFTETNVSGLKALNGPLVDNNTSGADLVSVRLNLLDLATSSDTSGTVAQGGSLYDNVTTLKDITINGLLAPNATGDLMELLNGVSTKVGSTATADANGYAIWNLTGVTTGAHHYTVWDTSLQIPVVFAGNQSASALDVKVL